MSDQNMTALLLLSANNFTPMSRTPWASDVISKRYKNQLTSSQDFPEKIGESWELSCDSNFPSRVLNQDCLLSALADMSKVDLFSPTLIENGRDQFDLLIKLLSAEKPLSVQIHPENSYANLKAHEGGKHESWLVLEAEKGCGLYLGLKDKLSTQSLEEALRSGEDISDLLQFVPVKKGDYFDIPPGTLHAIGKGVTLLEPQHVLPGKSGVTYRLWDWNRKYDQNGLENPSGQARQLHLSDGLKQIKNDSNFSEAYVETLRKIPQITSLANESATWQSYPANPYYQTHFINVDKAAKLNFKIKFGYLFAMPLQGNVTVEMKSGEKRLIPCGQPFLVPYAGREGCFNFNDRCDLVLVTPADKTLSITCGR